MNFNPRKFFHQNHVSNISTLCDVDRKTFMRAHIKESRLKFPSIPKLLLLLSRYYIESHHFEGCRRNIKNKGLFFIFRKRRKGEKENREEAWYIDGVWPSVFLVCHTRISRAVSGQVRGGDF